MKCLVLGIILVRLLIYAIITEEHIILVNSGVREELNSLKSYAEKNEKVFDKARFLRQEASSYCIFQKGELSAF